MIGELVCDFGSCDLNRFAKRTIDGKLTWCLRYGVQVRLGDKAGVLTVKAVSKGKDIGSTRIKFVEN